MKRNLAKRLCVGMTLAALVMAAGTPGQAVQTNMSGHVLVPYGSSGSADRIQYQTGGCAEDHREGTHAAFFDVRGFDLVKLKVTGADQMAPGANPSADGYLVGSCDPANTATINNCRAFLANNETCTMTVGNARYLEVSFATNATAWLGVRVTVSGIS